MIYTLFPSCLTSLTEPNTCSCVSISSAFTVKVEIEKTLVNTIAAVIAATPIFLINFLFFIVFSLLTNNFNFFFSLSFFKSLHFLFVKFPLIIYLTYYFSALYFYGSAYINLCKANECNLL